MNNQELVTSLIIKYLELDLLDLLKSMIIFHMIINFVTMILNMHFHF